MAKLNVPPTKSSYLSLSSQLESAREGYDLLDQKRQILVHELLSRLERARAAERRVGAALAAAYEALQAAVLVAGSSAIDRAALGVQFEHQVELSPQGVMGIRLPTVAALTAQFSVQFGFGGTTAQLDNAMRRFVEVLPLLAEAAELENSVIRLADELRKTQRRCNALSKIVIPNYSETIDYILSSLEERERESFIIQKMIKDRLASQTDGDRI